MTANWQWFPVLPLIMVFGTAVIALGLLGYGSWLLARKHLPQRSILQLAALRLGMILVLMLGLLRPVLSVPQSVEQAPGVMILVDASASMTAAAGEGTRWDEVQQLVQKSPALQSSGRSRPLHWFTFDRRATPTSPADLARMQPTGEATHTAASLKSAWNYVRLQHAAQGGSMLPARALIISDGRDDGAEDVAAVAKELGLVVDVLAPSQGRDQSVQVAGEILLVQSARRVLLGSETSFQLTVRRQPGPAPLTLTVEEDGQERARQELGPTAAVQEEFVMVKIRPDEPGLRRYLFRLRQGETDLGEIYAVNVQVVDDNHDILILEDAWRWEFKYLRRVLEDDPSFNLTALLSRGENAFVQFGEPERRVKLGGFPQSRAELDGFDTIVLGDVRPASWPRGLARNVQNAVMEGGKSLVVVAGAHLGEWVEVPELVRLLPVELSRESGSPITGEVNVRLTPEGRLSGRFTLSGKGDESDAVATLLPPLDHVYPTVRKRPAATVFLETVEHRNAEGQIVVAAEQTVGRGRVLFLATDTLWKWQTHGPKTDSGVTLYSSFWQQALRALTPADPTSGRQQVFLRPERTHYRSGETVRVAVEFSSGETEGPLPVLEGTVVLPDGRRVPLAFSAVGLVSGQTPQGSFSLPTAGRYRIEATALRDGESVADTFAVIEVAPSVAESVTSPVDSVELERWAQETGGRVVDPGSAAGWMTPESLSKETVVRRQAYDLWHNYTLVLLLCLLMAVDWTLRLFRGYV